MGALRTSPWSCCPPSGHVAEPLRGESGDPVPPAQGVGGCWLLGGPRGNWRLQDIAYESEHNVLYLSKLHQRVSFCLFCSHGLSARSEWAEGWDSVPGCEQEH